MSVSAMLVKPTEIKSIFSTPIHCKVSAKILFFSAHLFLCDITKGTGTSPKSNAYFTILLLLVTIVFCIL